MTGSWGWGWGCCVLYRPFINMSLYIMCAVFGKDPTFESGRKFEDNVDGRQWVHKHVFKF